MSRSGCAISPAPSAFMTRRSRRSATNACATAPPCSAMAAAASPCGSRRPNRRCRPTRNPACISASTRRTRRPCRRSTPPRCAPAAATMAGPAFAANTAPAITPHSRSTPTAIASKHFAVPPPAEEDAMPDDSRKLLWKADELPAQERAFSQRLNPNSHLLRTGLSRLAGLQRAHVSLGRIPPGKDSFAYHAHTVEEEWVYILAGRGLADIDGKQYEGGPGQLMSFPTPGT